MNINCIMWIEKVKRISFFSACATAGLELKMFVYIWKQGFTALTFLPKPPA